MRILNILLIGLLACGTTRQAHANTKTLSSEEQISKIVKLKQLLSEEQSAVLTFNTLTINIDQKIDDDVVDFINKQVKVAQEDNSIKEVWFRFNSYGGEIEAGTKIMDIMEHVGKPTVCVADHKAESMAAVLMQVCDKRLMTKRSFLMYHEPLVGTQGNSHQLQQDIEELRVANRALAEVVCARTGMKVSDYLDKINNKLWLMNYDEALKRNFIDGVIEPSQVPYWGDAKPIQNIFRVLFH